nr:hypothetical protein [Atopobium sp. oral taxon 416]
MRQEGGDEIVCRECSITCPVDENRLVFIVEQEVLNFRENY